MRKLKRSKCAVLTLVLKRKWFDAIDRGEKRVEFREVKPFWTRRIENWCARMEGRTPILEFQCGYRADAPRMAFVAGDGDGLIFEHLTASTPVQHPDLGEFPGPRFCLFIGERVSLEEAADA